MAIPRRGEKLILKEPGFKSQLYPNDMTLVHLRNL